MRERTLLVPLDGSRFAEAALPVALGLARSLNAGIELVTVFEDELPVATWQLTGVELRSLLAEYLDAVAGRMREVSPTAVRPVVLTGRAAQTLERHAAETHPELVVMSTHGRGPLSRAWLGSVADHVTRHVPMAVLLVRPREGTEPRLSDTHRFRRLLVPLDGSRRGEASLEWAERLARAGDAGITLVRVVPPPFPLTSPYMPHVIAETQETLESGRREALEYLAGVAACLEQKGLPRPEAAIEVGVSPALGILRQAERAAADLIVITTHARSGLPRLVLGSVADKLVRAAEVPVLVTRAPE